MPLLFVLYALVPVVQIGVFLGTREALDPAAATNYAGSILCLHWMWAQSILAAKVPVLQRMVPYDARIRFHIWASAGIIVTLLYHGVYKIWEGKTIDLISWVLLGTFSVFLFLALLWVPVLGSFLKIQALTYDRSKVIHGALQLGLAGMLFLHIAGSSLFNDLPAPSILVYLGYFAAAVGGFVLSKTSWLRVGATVVGLETQGEILTLRLAPDRKIRYRTGQFAFLRTSGPQGQREDHPFSFLSDPSETLVSFAIRARGDFTRGLDGLKPGDRVWVNGGFGNFRPGREKGLCFVSTGIGVVPFLSILKGLHAAGDQRPLHLHISVGDPNEIPDRSHLETLAAAMPTLKLRVHVKPTGDQRFSAEYFKRELGDTSRYTYFLCAGPRIQEELSKALGTLGVTKADIRREIFVLG